MRRLIPCVLAILMTTAVLGGAGCSSDDSPHRRRDRDRDDRHDRDDDRRPHGGRPDRDDD